MDNELELFAMYTLPGVSQEYWKSINRNECIERSFQDVSYWCASLTPPSTYRRCLFSLCEGSVYRVWKKSTAFDSRTPDATGQMVTTEQVASFSLPNSAPSFSPSLPLSPVSVHRTMRTRAQSKLQAKHPIIRTVLHEDRVEILCLRQLTKYNSNTNEHKHVLWSSVSGPLDRMIFGRHAIEGVTVRHYAGHRTVLSVYTHQALLQTLTSTRFHAAEGTLSDILEACHRTQNRLVRLRSARSQSNWIVDTMVDPSLFLSLFLSLKAPSLRN